MKILYIQIIFSIIQIVIYSSNSFDVNIVRNAYNYEIKNDQIANLEDLKPCQDENTVFDHNLLYTEVVCHQQDVFYNINIIVGNIHKKYQSFQLSIDTTTPYSWLKQEDCKQCASEDKNKVYTNIFNKQTTKNKKQKNKFDGCQVSCTDYNIFNTFGTIDQEKILLQSMIVIKDEDVVYGNFINDSALLWIYNENKKMNFKQFIESELKQDYQNKMSEVVEIEQWKLIYGKYLVGFENYQADGALGLGFIDMQQDDKNYVEGSNFINTITKRYSDMNNVFGLYIGEMCDYKPDFFITLGGYSQQYSHSGSINPLWIPLVPTNKRSQYWALQAEEIKVGLWNNYQKNPIPSKYKAIISTNASYLALPKDVLKQFVLELNEKSEMGCIIVDQQLFYVRCKETSVKSIYNLQMEIKFEGQITYARFEAIDLFRNCLRKIENHKSKQNESTPFECTLNVRASKTDEIILGEPFLKQHYTLFDMENRQIGLLHTLQDDSFMNQFRRGLMEFTLRWITILFIAFMIFVCFYKQLKKMYKLVRNEFRAKKFQNEVLEIQSLTRNNDNNNNSLNIQNDSCYIDQQDIEEFQKDKQEFEQATEGQSLDNIDI